MNNTELDFNDDEKRAALEMVWHEIFEPAFQTMQNRIRPASPGRSTWGVETYDRDGSTFAALANSVDGRVYGMASPQGHVITGYDNVHEFSRDKARACRRMLKAMGHPATVVRLINGEVQL